jgi:predicted O-linked N-acetylglucosamine transferase (SPINDLY family)
LPELVTASLAEYEALALKLAASPLVLDEFKERLQRNRLTYPLFNTERFCHHIEAAFVTMWQRAERGDSPVSFSVPDDTVRA